MFGHGNCLIVLAFFFETTRFGAEFVCLEKSSIAVSGGPQLHNPQFVAACRSSWVPARDLQLIFDPRSSYEGDWLLTLQSRLRVVFGNRLTGGIQELHHNID